MIDVDKKDLRTIRSILEEYVPYCQVRAFGSRVAGSAWTYSDLDIVIVCKNKIEFKKLNQLKEAFEESPLDFRIEVLDWHRISPEFQANIKKNFVIIKKDKPKSPKGWRYKKVSAFAEIVKGGTPKKTVKKYYNGDIPWIQPADLRQNKSKYIYTGKLSITKEGLKNSSARIVPKNTVLLSTRPPIGHIAIASKPVTTNQGVTSLIVKESFSYEFIYYLLLNNLDYIKKYVTGTAFNELSSNTLKNLRFQVPKFVEQKAIAKILSDNQTTKDIIQTIYKHHFSDSDAVKEKGEQYKASHLKANDFINTFLDSENLKNIDPQKISNYILSKLMSGEIRVVSQEN